MTDSAQPLRGGGEVQGYEDVYGLEISGRDIVLHHEAPFSKRTETASLPRPVSGALKAERSSRLCEGSALVAAIGAIGRGLCCLSEIRSSPPRDIEVVWVSPTGKRSAPMWVPGTRDG
jgi:hypothetical protein